MDGGSYRVRVGVLAGGTYAPAGSYQPLKLSPALGATQLLAAGTGDGQCDLVVVREVELAAGASLTLDLYDGSVKDIFGATAAFRKLRAVAAWVSAGGDAAGVDVGDDGTVTNPAPGFLKGTNPRAAVYPAGPPHLGGSPAGKAVTAAARNLLVKNQGAVSATLTLVLAGSTA